MKILHLSTYDISGGAARAAYRLHEGLQQRGVRSQMLVQERSSDDRQVIAPQSSLMQGIARSRNTLDIVPLKLLHRWQRSAPFSVQWLPEQVTANVAKLQPDLVNLHWIGGGFVQIETLAKLRSPLVWSLHDMWTFTGGCHYSGECDRYTQSCGACPLLPQQNAQDLTRWIWQRKAKAWKNTNLTLVALSHWLADCARKSSLLQNHRIELIPNGLDTETYRPIAKSFARELLKLPADKQLILFSSIKATSEKRKGFHLLQPALQSLAQAGWQDQLELVVLGADAPEHPPDMGFKTHYLGTLKDDLSLAMAYSAVDVAVLPSSEDNLPNVVMEALACGTPAVGFEIGGLPDLIEHQRNGYLAKPFQIADLAQGIAWVLESSRHANLCQRAREKTEQEFTLALQAKRYEQLYGDLLIDHDRLMNPVAKEIFA
ncbi:MAG: glycosyltransferase family 4 protein [Oculatellaceae cyanobacterium Prado106]|jgi:glycosyltransferase involved in cell wall biosynthesis|nr:glycosyltransferase family 4 protein [Oculatellaceae cyanobacterium Prado106]